MATIQKSNTVEKLRIHSGKRSHTGAGGTSPDRKRKGAGANRDYRISIRGRLPPDLCQRISTIHAAALSKGCIPFLDELEADVKSLPSSEQGNHRAKAPLVAPPIVASSSKTFATGITGLTRYEFEFKIADATKLIASNNPFTFAPNPKYPKELQPRLRERVATRLQVENIAANLEPDALLTDYKSIDRGAPIVGSDGVVESGNGRVMAIILAAKQHPEVYAKYKEALKAVAPSYALSVELVDKFKVPMLVREKLTKVDRKQFVEESNISTTIESSPIEKARTDAAKLTLDMLTSLELLEGEAIEDALRSLRNKPFVTKEQLFETAVKRAGYRP